MSLLWKDAVIKSALYTGHVRHNRTSPIENAFSYSLFMLYIDLEELSEVFHGRWLWSSERFNIAYFRRKDHVGNPQEPLHESVRKLVAERGGVRPEGPIRILTHLRYFGYCFNPVSFYYCYDRKDTHVQTIVAEIHNTPWGEEHCYVLHEHENRGSRKEKRFQFKKEFHVSPFIEMDMIYDWMFTEPGEEITVRMEDLCKGKTFFKAELNLRRREISGRSLALVLFQYPFMTGKVISAIYWQALRLWLKGAKLYVHPSKRKYINQTGEDE